MLFVLLLGCTPMGSPEPATAPTEGAGGTAAEKEVQGTKANETPAARTAVATLESKSDSSTTGTVTFRETPLPAGTTDDSAAAFKQGPSELAVTIELVGAPPGEHAVHVHEHGDCSAPDAASAGGHFAGPGHPHGRPDAPFTEKHPGDLGNVTVGPDGRGRGEVTIRSATLGAGQVSIDGLSVVVHAQPDKFTQPSGDAGDRIACGVIKASEGG